MPPYAAAAPRHTITATVPPRLVADHASLLAFPAAILVRLSRHEECRR